MNVVLCTVYVIRPWMSRQSYTDVRRTEEITVSAPFLRALVARSLQVYSPVRSRHGCLLSPSSEKPPQVKLGRATRDMIYTRRRKHGDRQSAGSIRPAVHEGRRLRIAHQNSEVRRQC